MTVTAVAPSDEASLLLESRPASSTREGWGVQADKADNSNNSKPNTVHRTAS